MPILVSKVPFECNLRHYSVGANQAAVRCVAPTARGLLVAGDDGNVIVYDF
jgi:hypothetical protein